MKMQTIIRSLWMGAIMLLLHAGVYAQGVTTGSIGGKVTDKSGEALIGANILAVHLPSGTTYGTATNVDGFYRIPNMRVGGPYRITVSYTGYEELEENNVQLGLGQSFRFNPILEETAYEIGEITVVASESALFDTRRTGQKTVVDERQITDVPTVSRAIQDFARLNPLASIGEGVDGFSVSLAGQNNRYNTIYFDGAVNNDVFGLAGSGTNGGQTGVQPISIDAIEQFTIAVAPFDVRQSGFAGGAINAITRSGTNELEGSAYMFYRDQSLSGDELDGDPVSDFSAMTYGFRLGGPIKKDKIFFFFNAELQDDETPQTFNFNDYVGEASIDKINQLANAMQERYGYDIGNWDNNTAYLKSTKLLGKIDWNLSDVHKLSIRHSYLKAENLEARASDPNDIQFLNGSEFFVSTTNSTAIELNSIFSNTLSNRLTVGLTFVRDDRDPFGDPFPSLDLDDLGNADWTLGAEQFSTANLLNQDVITINNDLTLYKGRHSLLFGANLEYFNAGNLFIRANYGFYNWRNVNGVSGIDRFLAGEPASQYSSSFSQVDNVAGDESSAIAAFEQMLLGFYVQDEFQATDRLTLTGGLRVDFPLWLTDQPENAQFNNTTIPLIESFGYDLQGARTGSFISSSLAFSPRLGFNWDVNGNQTTQLRGGIGIFTSRLPLVWPGGAYNNYGFNIGGTSGTNVPFEPNVQNQPVGFDTNGNPIRDVNLDNPAPSGQIDLFAEDFKLPQVLKINLAIDQKLPLGLIGTLEALYSKNINAPFYQNLNIKPAVRTLNGGPDQRPLFEGGDPGFGGDVIDPTYNYIMLASNINEGYSYNIAATITKPFRNGFAASVAYSYNDAFAVLDATSSQNNSQWRAYRNPLGRNLVGDAQRSQFAGGHRVFGQASYEIDYLDFAKSKLAFNFNAQTGGYFGYGIGARNFNFIDDQGRDNEPMYIPETQADINLVDLTYQGQTYTAAQQWQLLNDFIENDPYLSANRGQYSEANGGKEPMEFTIDLRFLQDFYITTAKGKRNTLQLSVDIFNFTNLLNQDWGRIRFVPSGNGIYPLVDLRNNVTGNDTTPRYTINPDLIQGEQPWDGNFDQTGLRSSLWQMQVGVRYIFN